MKRSEIYREAARLVEMGAEQYSCIAIANAAHGWARQLPCNEYEESRIYVETFADHPDELNRLFSQECEDAQDLRILALCLMAAIAEDDE